MASRGIGEPIEADSEEEFKAAVDQLTIDIMDAIYRHRPDIGQVVDSCLQVLLGTLQQIEPGEKREKMRSIMVNAIMQPDDEDIVGVDLSERFFSKKDN